MIITVVIHIFQGILMDVSSLYYYVLTAGEPRPTVTWVKVDGPLSASAQVIDSLLILPSISLDDAGTYRCVASNVAGTVFDQVLINVEGMEYKKLKQY